MSALHPANDSSSATNSPPTQPDEPEIKYIPQGKAVDRALAIQLDEACMNRWGETLYDEFYPGVRAQKSAEEVLRTCA